MSLNFPISPALNETHTVGSKTWKWNGYAWDLNTSANASFQSLVVTGNTVSQHIIPSANVTYDLGAASSRFRDLYLSGNTINLGSATVSANGTAIELPAGTKVGNKNLSFEDVSTITLDTEISTSDSGLSIYKLTRYRDLVISQFSSNTINSLSATSFNSVYSTSEEPFNTTMVCDNEDDIIITLPASNTITVGFNITINRLNIGDITFETSPDSNSDSIRYGGWKFEKLKLLYMKDRQLSEFQNAKLSTIPSLNGIYPPAGDFADKYTFKYTYIGNSTYMLSA